MVWRETINHLDNCYFKFVDVPGFNKKTKQHLQYDIPSARQPVALSEEIHAPLTTELPEIEVEALSSSASEGEDDETDLFEPSGADCDKLSLFSQSELNDLIGDLYLPKQSA